MFICPDSCGAEHDLWIDDGSDMIDEVRVNRCYVSPSGVLFRVDDIRKHGQQCDISMVCYTNLEPTKDYPVGSKWVIEESLFLKQFRETERAAPHPTRIVFLDFDGVLQSLTQRRY